MRSASLFCGYGYMLECPVTRTFMDARVQRTYVGTNDVMTVIVAKQLGLRAVSRDDVRRGRAPRPSR